MSPWTTTPFLALIAIQMVAFYGPMMARSERVYAVSVFILIYVSVVAACMLWVVLFHFVECHNSRASMPPASNLAAHVAGCAAAIAAVALAWVWVVETHRVGSFARIIAPRFTKVDIVLTASVYGTVVVLSAVCLLVPPVRLNKKKTTTSPS